MPPRLAWNRKIAGHGEIFNLLAGVAGDPVLLLPLTDARGTSLTCWLHPDRRMASSLSGVTREMEQYLETPGSSGVGGALTTRRRFRRSPGQTYTKVR